MGKAYHDTAHHHGRNVESTATVDPTMHADLDLTRVDDSLESPAVS